MEYSSKVACLVALAFAMAAGIATPCAAQNLPQDYVYLHNVARAAEGVRPVSWDHTVAAYAQWYADQRRGDCQLVLSGGQYGENLSTGDSAWTGADAVNYWVSQKKYYNPGSNTCSAPPPDKSCNLYLEVVWPDTTAIGCARDVCDNGGVFIICNYYPRPGLPP